MPAWTRYAKQNVQSLLYEAVFWNPVEKYEWKSQRPVKPSAYRIYEAHVGMVSAFGNG